MRYTSFRIQNFKGIRDTTVNLDTLAGASVFAFVGLNESGKTTVLEAIHSFSPENDAVELLGGEGIGVPYSERVPRHLISSFTGDVSVEARLTITAADKHDIVTELSKSHGLEVNVDELPNNISMERIQRFQNGDLKSHHFNLNTKIQVRTAKQRKWREPEAEEIAVVREAFYSRSPDIAYFPTFVFEFPERIFLTARRRRIDSFYRSVFQDILDHDGRGYTIEKDIIRRLRGEGMVSPWLTFLSNWTGHRDREKIQHVIDRASMQVTKLVFERWNKIFREDTKGKEIVIAWDVVEGEKRNQQGGN